MEWSVFCSSTQNESSYPKLPSMIEVALSGLLQAVWITEQI